MKAVEIEHLRFSYGEGEVLKDINLTVEKGEFCVLLGSNGAGKTTLMKLLLGELALRKEDGKIELLGEPIRNFHKWGKVGYVPQNGTSVYRGFPASVREVVQANLYSGMFRRTSKGQKNKVRETLKLVGMEGFAERLIGRLSGGQLQRVLLARALVSQPELLVLDEPTTGIDRENSAAFLALLKELNQKHGVTVLMITHDRNRIKDLADKIWLLEDGQLEREEKQDGNL